MAAFWRCATTPITSLRWKNTGSVRSIWLVVNLYPFEETVAGGADYDTAIENIDIGGPAMIRAAAKNHKFVNVVVDVADYDAVLAETYGQRRHHLCVPPTSCGDGLRAHWGL